MAALGPFDYLELLGLTMMERLLQDRQKLLQHKLPTHLPRTPRGASPPGLPLERGTIAKRRRPRRWALRRDQRGHAPIPGRPGVPATTTTLTKPAIGVEVKDQSPNLRSPRSDQSKSSCTQNRSAS